MLVKKRSKLIPLQLLSNFTSMKKIHIALLAAFWVGFFSLPILGTGCTSTQQSSAYVTLDATGRSAKASMDASTALLKQGAITVAQWQKIADTYDNVFQPAYALAVAAAGTLSAPTPQSLVNQQVALSSSVKNLTP